MTNDKAFLTYTAGLALGIMSILTYFLTAQATHVPDPSYILEHVAMGLIIRAYYKSFDGDRGFYAATRGVRNYFGIGATEDVIPGPVATSY